MSGAGRPRGRTLRLLECVLCFFVLPPTLYVVRHRVAFRLIPLILAVAAGCAVFLVRTRGMERGSLWGVAGLRTHLRGVLAVAVPAGTLVAALTLWFVPLRFLALPRQSPGAWAAVMLLYPILAALPQEVIFRAFFFARYGALFPNPAALVVCNGLSFGLAHVLYGNWTALALSTLGGWLFAYRYLRTRSLLAVSLEHGLWGDLLFTLGIGWYLYSGSIQ